MNNGLFNEFNPVSAKQWKQKIQFELKGEDYNETLIWKSNEDISVKPFYHSEDFKELPEASNTTATQFNICQSIFVADVQKSNKKAINAIKNGIESIQFIIPSESVSINELLENIDLNNIPVYFNLQFLSESFIKQLNAINTNAGFYILTDIIGNLARNGNCFKNLNSDFDILKNVV